MDPTLRLGWRRRVHEIIVYERLGDGVLKEDEPESKIKELADGLNYVKWYQESYRKGPETNIPSIIAFSVTDKFKFSFLYDFMSIEDRVEFSKLLKKPKQNAVYLKPGLYFHRVMIYYDMFLTIIGIQLELADNETQY